MLRTTKEERLLGYITKKCLDNNVKIHYIPNKYVLTNGHKVSGYFHDKTKNDLSIRVASDRQDFIEVLAHEYCHLTQYLDGFFNDESIQFATHNYDEWLLEKAEYKDDVVDEMTKAFQYLEWENEGRTIKLMDFFNMDYDKSLYIKKANVYILSYEVIARHRKWPEVFRPYEFTPLLNMVSGANLIPKKDFGNLPKHFEEVFVESLYKNDFE